MPSHLVTPANLSLPFLRRSRRDRTDPGLAITVRGWTLPPQHLVMLCRYHAQPYSAITNQNHSLLHRYQTQQHRAPPSHIQTELNLALAILDSTVPLQHGAMLCHHITVRRLASLKRYCCLLCLKSSIIQASAFSSALSASTAAGVDAISFLALAFLPAFLGFVAASGTSPLDKSASDIHSQVNLP